MRAHVTDRAYALTEIGYPDYVLIKNLDPTNSVYADDSVTAPATYGVELSPGGGITWAPHHPCYLQCPTGLTAQVAYVFGTNLT